MKSNEKSVTVNCSSVTNQTDGPLVSDFGVYSKVGGSFLHGSHITIPTVYSYCTCQVMTNGVIPFTTHTQHSCAFGYRLKNLCEFQKIKHKNTLNCIALENKHSQN